MYVWFGLVKVHNRYFSLSLLFYLNELIYHYIGNPELHYLKNSTEMAGDFVMHIFCKFRVLFFCPGQIRLCNTSLLIVGAGGLGCPVAQYLASAGVGKKLLLRNCAVPENIHTPPPPPPPHGRFLFCITPSPMKFQFSFILSSPGISGDLPWGRYGFFFGTAHSTFYMTAELQGESLSLLNVNFSKQSEFYQ